MSGLPTIRPSERRLEFSRRFKRLIFGMMARPRPNAKITAYKLLSKTASFDVERRVSRHIPLGRIRRLGTQCCRSDGLPVAQLGALSGPFGAHRDSRCPCACPQRFSAQAKPHTDRSFRAAAFENEPSEFALGYLDRHRVSSYDSSAALHTRPISF